MTRLFRPLGCAIALTLLALLGVSLWVGIRVGAATGAPAAPPAEEPPAFFMRRLKPPLPLRERHGAVGVVEAVEAHSVTISALGGQRVIAITPETMIVRDDSLIAVTDIPPGARIAVIGRPRADGQLEARLLRVILPDTDIKPFDRKRRSEP